MRLWYDVSDPPRDPTPFRAESSRTVAGIYAGLVALGWRPHLLAWDESRSGFTATGTAALAMPPRVEPVDGCHTARNHAGSETAPAVTTAAVGSSSRLAPGPCVRLATARRHTAGFGRLCRTLRRCLRPFKNAPTENTAPPTAPEPHRTGSITRPLPAATTPVAHPCAAGDVLLSLGDDWSLPTGGPAVSALRCSGVRVVRLVRDLLPVIEPQWFDAAKVRGYARGLRNVLAHSDSLLTVSEFSRREIESYCADNGLRPPALAVVRLGDVADDDATPETGLARPRFVPSRPFFLCVAAVDGSRHHRVLIDAWRRYADRDPDGCPDLLCVGAIGPRATPLLAEVSGDPGLNGRVRFLHDVAPAEVAWYSRHCRGTVCGPRRDGWCGPVAESLALGKLSLAPWDASIPEISPALTEFFAPHDIDGLVTLVRRAVTDPAWVRTREDSIRGGFRRTRWAHTAAQVLSVVDRLDRSARKAA